MTTLFDRVAETSESNGTGNIALEGALNGYRRFSEVLPGGGETYYVIEHQIEDQWEIGLGTLTGNTLGRDEVLESSNDGELVAFTAGEKRVFIDAPAALLNAVDTYTHNQDVASATWDITHNLNRYPSISIVDSTGTLVLGQVDYLSAQAVRLSFSAAFSGKAYLN